MQNESSSKYLSRITAILMIILLFLCCFVLTLAGTYFYRLIAIKYGIIAKKNFRTLHEINLPKGGGIVFSLVFLIFSLYLCMAGIISTYLAVPLLVGGLLISIFGLIDDKYDIPANIKFVIQFSSSVFLLYWFEGVDLLFEPESMPLKTGASGIVLGMIMLCWWLNAYNFMDGIDGMVASETVFICVLLGILITVNYPEYSSYASVLALLAAVCLAFLVFNWPPAKIFMGDAGSLFLGFTFSVLILFSMEQAIVTVWQWLIVFSYFVFDTGITLLLRIIKVRKWYGVHRSHAYQNLARIWGDHKRVTGLVMLYNLLWITPLTILSVLYPTKQLLFFMLAAIPVIGWTLKFGPLLSKD